MVRLHGTAVAIGGRAVLLRGEPGAGKSDLAARLIADGAMLVADDQVELTRNAAGTLMAAPPETIAGLIELRGVGIRRLPYLATAPLVLVVDLVAPEAVERLPEPAEIEIDGVRVPLLALTPFEASAAAKLTLVMATSAYPSATTGAPDLDGYKEGP